eukprot:7385393-Prymnesium_polylepis.1
MSMFAMRARVCARSAPRNMTRGAPDGHAFKQTKQFGSFVPGKHVTYHIDRISPDRRLAGQDHGTRRGAGAQRQYRRYRHGLLR